VIPAHVVAGEAVRPEGEVAEDVAEDVALAVRVHQTLLFFV
jgi:hypothetical protein